MLIFSVMSKHLSGGSTYVGEVNIGENPHGKGFIFYPNGTLMFEGQFYRGRKEGEGKQFYPNGALEFQVKSKDF
jgi:antitoxin component YwqK of YwqJK toxin-antitoxin module